MCWVTSSAVAGCRPWVERAGARLDRLALAPTVHVLWVGAALSGLGAGAMFPASLALVAAVTDTPLPGAGHRPVGRIPVRWCGRLAAARRGVRRGRHLACVVPVIAAGLAAVTVLVTLLLSTESTAPEGRGFDTPARPPSRSGCSRSSTRSCRVPRTGWAQPHILIALLLGVVFLVAFVVVERRAATPLLDLDIFRNRAFSVASIVTVVGMFAFLGSCFSFSIWLGAVQHQAPARVGIPLLLIQAPAFVLIPVISRLLTRVSARWLLTTGFALIAVGTWLASRLEVTNMSLVPMVAPALLIGVGFALSVSSFTAVAINTVRLHLAGMAIATKPTCCATSVSRSGRSSSAPWP